MSEVVKQIYTLEDKYRLIKEELLKDNSKNPVTIAKRIMHNDFINIHGPEHHFLDGGAFLTAYHNAVGNINLKEALDQLSERTIKIPGGICGAWAFCGSAASVGAALSVIHNTFYGSKDDYYKDHMEYTSKVISSQAKIGGPRCCKRNAFLSLSLVVQFVKEKYNIKMEIEKIKCEFFIKNKDCIKERCPFYTKSQ